MVSGEPDNDCEDSSKKGREEPLESGKRFRAPTHLSSEPSYEPARVRL
jgi:hypothetical protein